jgi:hypothetical protein
MSASPRKHQQQREPDMLRRHKLLYEARLQELHLLKWLSEHEAVDKSNNPEVYTKAAEAQSENENPPHPGPQHK